MNTGKVFKDGRKIILGLHNEMKGGNVWVKNQQ